MDAQIKEAIRTYVEKISSDNDVLRIYLFGSCVYGVPHERSDIDLMVVIDDALHTIRKSSTLRKHLRGYRTVPMDMLVNRISDFEKSQTFPSIQKTIKEKGLLLYEREQLSTIRRKDFESIFASYGRNAVGA
ncbi:MAG: nucleotidyltransferase domain-containing protein [Defluviitaleaceae bacterium]|nr:nucleotidyltransferase domain-containing protein [Defluviitaleaceae bacterium]